MSRLAYPAAALFALMLCGAAQAAPKVSVKSTSYAVSGKTGAAILADLERKGPRHGFLTRAIAQTHYKMNAEADWKHEGGKCRVTRPLVRLDITYVYPRLSDAVAASVKQKWNRFMAGVVKHEEVHGRIATEMARAAHDALATIRVKGDGRGCERLRREMKRVVNAVVADYEKRQRRFDQVEHKDGGNIEGLVARLIN